jgi:hypothetical protein
MNCLGRTISQPVEKVTEALPASGRAWMLLASRKNLKPEKCL